MPVASVGAGKGACYSFQGRPGLNDGSVVDVHIVVEINEVVENCLTEYGQTKRGEKQIYTDNYTAPGTAAW
jgi:hypothetical protein